MYANCHICRIGSLHSITAFGQLTRVTSDAKPFPAGGSLAVCEHCGIVQKPITAAWQADADRIYAAYTIYHNAAGAEQNLFTGGGTTSRSAHLVRQIRSQVGFPETGRMLDLGCGNGAMLRSFSQQMPGWSLAGNELGDRYRNEIEAIPGVESLYIGEPESVPGAFDAITMLHVLEHVPDPVAYLRRLIAKLAPGGRIVVEVPDHRQTAFDLAVADHCTHFSLDTLRAVFEAAGLEVIAAADDIVPRELTVVGVAGYAAEPRTRRPIHESVRFVEAQIAWLEDLARRGRDLTATVGRIGVFGTSLGGAWLLGQLGGSVAFFVDEDPAKIGREWDGRPIVSPLTAPDDVPVLIGLPHSIAANLKSRLDESKSRMQLHLPRAA